MRRGDSQDRKTRRRPASAQLTELQNYTTRIKQADEFGDKGLVIRLEDMLAEETDHEEELERLAR